MLTPIAGAFSIVQELPGGAVLGPALGLGATLSFVGAAIWYVVKFQKTFTDRLESERGADKKALEKSKRVVDHQRNIIGRLIYILIRQGIEVPPDILDWERTHDTVTPEQ